MPQRKKVQATQAAAPANPPAASPMGGAANPPPVQLSPNPLITALANTLVSNLGLIGAPGASNESIFASSPQTPELAAFAGYLGDTVSDAAGVPWRLLYLDPEAATWLLVPDAAIVHHVTGTEQTPPFQQRDVIWVTKDAPVRRGSGPESAQARFLTGSFTNAGDVSAPLTGGGILPLPTGDLCIGAYAGCGKRSRP